MLNHQMYLKGIDPSLFAYLTPAQERNLSEAVAAVDPDEVTALVADIFSQAPFTSSFWSDHGPVSQRWPIVALRAYLDGQIPKTVFVATAMLAGCCAEFGWNKMAFTYEDDSQSVSVEVKEATKKPLPGTKLFRSIQPTDPDYQKYFEIFAKVFSQDEQAQLCQSIQKLPLHNRILFVINLPIAPISSWSPLLHVLKRALQKYEGFFAISEEGSQPLECWKREWVITSISVYEKYLNHFGAGDCLKQTLVPVLGELQEREVACHQARFERVIGIGIPNYVPTPRVADGRHAGEMTFTAHDLYHAFKNQLRGFREWVAVSRMVHLLLTLPDREQTADFEELRGKIIDAELLATSKRASTIVPFGYFFQRDRFKCLWEANPKAKDMIFQDMVDHPHFWEGLLSNFGLHDDELALLASLKSMPTHPRHTPCPLMLDEHFGLPSGYLQEMEKYVAKPEDPKVAMLELIAALHVIHNHREQAFNNMKRLSDCPWRGSFSYQELARLLAYESEISFTHVMRHPLELIKRYVNFPERLLSLSLVNRCLSLTDRDSETLRSLNTYLGLSDQALNHLIEKFMYHSFGKQVSELLPVIGRSLPFLLDTEILTTDNPPLVELLLRHQDKIPKRCDQLQGYCVHSLSDGLIPFIAYPVDGEFYFITDAAQPRLEYLRSYLTECHRSQSQVDLDLIQRALSCSDGEFNDLCGKRMSVFS